ncbi:MAG: type II toxin-antitoxin system HicB family antitoxin [Acidobacteria bacterium]|nr:type II toxin-antitoxin system HicB family antitoxin [Acidobacteriota bacterium]
MAKAARVATASHFRVRFEREEDGRWLAIVDAIPGVMAYGATKKAALTSVKALTLRVLADLIENGEPVPRPTDVLFVAA